MSPAPPPTSVPEENVKAFVRALWLHYSEAGGWLDGYDFVALLAEHGIATHGRDEQYHMLPAVAAWLKGDTDGEG